MRNSLGHYYYYYYYIVSPHHSRFDKKFGMVLQNVKTSSQANVSLPSSNHIYIYLRTLLNPIIFCTLQPS